MGGREDTIGIVGHAHFGHEVGGGGLLEGGGEAGVGTWLLLLLLLLLLRLWGAIAVLCSLKRMLVALFVCSAGRCPRSCSWWRFAEPSSLVYTANNVSGCS